MTAAVDPEDYPREMVEDACAGATTMFEVARELRIERRSARWIVNYYGFGHGAGAGGDTTQPKS